MLADAIRAEGYRLSKNRTAVLWSVLFVPAIALVISAIANFALNANAAKLTTSPDGPAELKSLVAGGPLDLGTALVEVAGNLAAPPILLFVLIGAATLYAGDYRWETWRLISARNGRTNLLLGKVAVTAVLALLAMIAMFVAGVGDKLIKAAVFDRPLTFTMTGDLAGQIALISGLGWLNIVQFTMVGLLAATVTRSLLAALFIPAVLGVAQAISPNVFGGMGVMPDSWMAVLANPGGAFGFVQGMIDPSPGDSVPAGLALKAWTSIALWTALPLAGAVAWFKRQDLSKE